MAFTHTKVPWQDILTALRNAISAQGSGWQIIDDQSTLATNPYFVVAGEASDGTKMVLRVLNPKNWSYITITAYHDWDPSAHLGYTPSPTFSLEINRTSSIPQALIRLWVTATKQRLIIAIHGNYSRTDFQTVLIYFGEIKKYFAVTDTKKGTIVLAATGTTTEKNWANVGYVHTSYNGTTWAYCSLLEPVFATYQARISMAQFSPFFAPTRVIAAPVVVSSSSEGIRGRLIDLYATSRVLRSVAAVTPLTFRSEPFICHLLKGAPSSGNNYYGSFPVTYNANDYFVPSSPDCGAYIIKAV